MNFLELNMDFLRLLADFRTPALDTIFQSITWMAEETFVILVICWLYWCHDKALAYTLSFTYFLSGLLVQGMKLLFQIPRPWVLDPNFQPVKSAIAGAGGFSFPSGHTQSGTALFSTLGFKLKKNWMKALCFIAIFFIGFSRMYLGVHTPQDVVVSWVLTLILSYFVTFHLQNKIIKPENAKHFSIFLFALCAILTIYSTYFYFAVPEHANMAKSALKACGAGFGFSIGFYLERSKINFELPTTWKEKILRFIIGAVSVVILLGVFDATLKKFLVGRVLSYLLLIVWVMAGYPYVFSKFNKKAKQ